MAPITLEFAAHDDQAAVFKVNGMAFSAFPVMYPEDSGFADAERSQAGPRAQFFFAVRMPAHRIVAVTVKIAQDTVEALAGSFF